MNYKFDELRNLFYEKLIKNNFLEKDAGLLAKIFADNTFAGVASHGVMRFPLFVDYVKKGYIKTEAKPSLVNSFGAFEQWDGNFGAGPLNALQMTERGIDLSRHSGISCIAIKNTNHWMRGGYFGWYAAEKGFILICWTNTISNLPPWGAKEPKTGNNPFVIGIPRAGKPVVLDMAISQFSFGKMEELVKKDGSLPVAGGYNKNGELTNNPSEILESQRAIPIGFWKGSGLSLMIDIVAAVLSGGKSTEELSNEEIERGVSQIFIVINPALFSNPFENDEKIDKILSYFKSAEKADETSEIYYPGERAMNNKIKNMNEGIDIDDEILKKINEL